MKAPSEQISQVNRVIVGDLGDKLKIIGVEGSDVSATDIAARCA